MAVEKTNKAAIHIQSNALRKQRGQRVRQARLDAGLTVDQMSDRVQVARNTYRKIEQGEISPRISTLELVALYTETELDWLVSGNKKGVS